MKHSFRKLSVMRSAGALCAAVVMGGVLSGCTDTLLEGTPPWLGESIYQELQKRGNFTRTLELINSQSEDYASVLAKTGSKTLFVADDAAWNKFFETNRWGVKSIAEMSKAQKSILFKSYMIDQAYLVELLSNIPSASDTEAPAEGMAMRRVSSLSVLDSVPIVKKADYPIVNTARVDLNGVQVDYWSRIRGKDNILLMQDDQAAPMVHFLPKFMMANNISDADIKFMTNEVIESSEDAFVNGYKIVERDITCQNGYIHQLGGIEVPYDNMANVIAHNPQFSIFKRLLDRFSYPAYSAAMTTEYRKNIGGTDSVFVKRYFNEHPNHQFGLAQVKETNDQTVTSVDNVLPFDPGWNGYYQSSSQQAYGANTAFMVDAACMFVPTDDALLECLSWPDFRDIQEKYGEGEGETAWDNAPDEVVLPMLTNAMQTNIKNCIPSNFGSVNNSASEPLGTQSEVQSAISKSIWANNGLIYETKRVFIAPEYLSVFYPSVVRAHDDLGISYYVVTKDNVKTESGSEGYYAYLNNMSNKYTYFIPTDNALQTYYDPVTYGRKKGSQKKAAALKFKLDTDNGNHLAATPYICNWTSPSQRPTIGEMPTGTDQETYELKAYASLSNPGDACNRYKDILNSSLMQQTLVPGQRFYTARNFTPIIVNWEGDQVVSVGGSFQYEINDFIPVVEKVDKSAKGNGVSYIIDKEPIMSTVISPFTAIESDKERYGEFAKIFCSASMYGANSNKTDGAKHATLDKCIPTLNNFHYTLYVPTNEVMKGLTDPDNLAEDKQLPSWDDIDLISKCITKMKKLKNPTEEDEMNLALLQDADSVWKYKIEDFVKYHMHDHAMYLDGEEQANQPYESFSMDTTINRFYKVVVNYRRGDVMKVTDNVGHTREVVTANSNKLTRQLFFDTENLTGTSPDVHNIYSSANMVIHQIDGYLQQSENAFVKPADYRKIMEICEKYK